MPENLLVSSISAKELSINDIFCSNFSFEIPPYQRPYSWNREHAEQLLEDITEFAFKDDDYDKLLPYFVGSLVLIKDQTKRHAKVVDGQQRLTTFIILFSVLRHITKDAELKKDITLLIYEPGSKLKGTKDDFRLKLRPRDQDYFQRIIQKEGGLENLDIKSEVPDSHHRIRDNAYALLEKLESFKPEMIEKLVQFIGQKCFLVVVTSTDEDSAFRIFNVLNDRGLQLSHADILKSEILEKITASEQDIYTYKWESAEETLGIDKFKELFSHIRPIFAKKKAEESIIKEIRKYAKPTDDSKGFIDNVIIPFSEVYENIIKCNYRAVSYSDQINGKLKWLNRFENTDWIPSVLLYMSKYKAEPKKIFDFLSQLERLTLGLEILNANANKRVERFAELNTDIECNKDIFTYNEVFYFSSKEEDKIKKQLTGNSQYGKRYLKILLLKIDEKLSGGGATYDYPIISIEHVLPQTPKKPSQWTQWFNDIEREELVDSIGNLVLLTIKKNSSARNYEFDHKINKYFLINGVSPFPLTTGVLKYNAWSPQVIKQRTKEMANYALGILGLSGLP
jgi:uncharacterized protein with ParB-like and HNH nuclease domain